MLQALMKNGGEKIENKSKIKTKRATVQESPIAATSAAQLAS